MKSNTVVSVLVALTMGASGMSFAQSYRDRDDRGYRERARVEQRSTQQTQRYSDEYRQGRRNMQDRRDDDRGRYDRSDNRGRAYDYGRREWRGAGPDHSYYRGSRLPARYNHRQYVVSDWRGHRLSAPPRGYHWVQSGSDYLLVAIATGLIAQLLLDY